jgi:hypothetical protein
MTDMLSFRDRTPKHTDYGAIELLIIFYDTIIEYYNDYSSTKWEIAKLESYSIA